MAEKSVLHRDIKTENILLNHKNDLKISDFGLSCFGNDILTNDDCGTYLFFAPETHQCFRYSHLSDMYAVGLVFYELLFGELPFSENDNFEGLMQKKLVYEFRVPENPKQIVSQKSIEILTNLLKADYKQRMTAKEVIDKIDSNVLTANSGVKMFNRINPSLSFIGSGENSVRKEYNLVNVNPLEHLKTNNTQSTTIKSDLLSVKNAFYLPPTPQKIIRKIVKSSASIEKKKSLLETDSVSDIKKVVKKIQVKIGQQ